MKFYTIQKLKAWEEAKSHGVLTGDKDYIDEDWLLDSYIWIMKQMKKRLKDYNDEFPVWLWLDTSNIYFNELLEDEYVLLEVSLPEEQVLISNFDAWHTVINNWHLDEENDTITKEESWEYIFDKEKLDKLGYGFDNEDLQGVTGIINCKDIKVLKYILNEK